MAPIDETLSAGQTGALAWSQQVARWLNGTDVPEQALADQVKALLGTPFGRSLLDLADATALADEHDHDGTYALASDPLGLGICSTVDPMVAAATASVGSSNRTSYGRVVGSGEFTKIGVTIGVQSGNICVAHYANSGSGRDAAPAARQQTSGSVACPAVGWAEVALGAAATVSNGDWFSVAADNTTATFGAIGASAVAPSNAYKGRSAYEDAAFPSPATATPTAGLIRGFLLIGVE